MRTLAGLAARVHFTHLSSSAAKSLSGVFAPSDKDNGKAEGLCHTIGILDLIKQDGTDLEKVCLLDPKAETELSPGDGDGRFTHFLFGVRHFTFFSSSPY